jgi:hypothetical protein
MKKTEARKQKTGATPAPAFATIINEIEHCPSDVLEREMLQRAILRQEGVVAAAQKTLIACIQKLSGQMAELDRSLDRSLNKLKKGN